MKTLRIDGQGTPVNLALRFDATHEVSAKTSATGGGLIAMLAGQPLLVTELTSMGPFAASDRATFGSFIRIESVQGPLDVTGITGAGIAMWYSPQELGGHINVFDFTTNQKKPLWVDASLIHFTGNVAVSGPVGTDRTYNIESDGVRRWSWGGGSEGAGANTDTGWFLGAWADDGVTVLDIPIYIPRPAGSAIQLLRRVNIGTVTGGQASSTPMSLNLGSTYADTSGDVHKTKLRLFDDGTLIYGIGVSIAAGFQMEYHVPDNSSHAFYENNVNIGSFNRSSTAGETSLILLCVDTGAVQRVKTTAPGTVAGVGGRVLFV